MEEDNTNKTVFGSFAGTQKDFSLERDDFAAFGRGCIYAIATSFGCILSDNG
jgi:hypothetical protein